MPITDHQPVPGHCFEDAVMFMASMPDALLCHGYPLLASDCKGVPKGTPFGHAWIERPNQVPALTACYDHMHMNNPLPAAIYYSVGQIDPAFVRRYTVTQMLKMLKDTDHYGPWHKGPDGSH